MARADDPPIGAKVTKNVVDSQRRRVVRSSLLRQSERRAFSLDQAVAQQTFEDLGDTTRLSAVEQRGQLTLGPRRVAQ
jgi:hypothetical protein